MSRAARNLASMAADGGVSPDLGAWRAADLLASRLGLAVTAAGIEELAARGAIRPTHKLRGVQLYSGEDLAALADPAVVAGAQASRDRTAAEAAAYMRIREKDFRLLAKVGMIPAARYCYGQWARFPLYACATLDAFLARADIDWAAVRATPRNRRSLLYYLAEPELIMHTLATL